MLSIVGERELRLHTESHDIVLRCMILVYIIIHIHLQLHRHHIIIIMYIYLYYTFVWVLLITVIGRAGASLNIHLFIYTCIYIYIRVIRRALNLLRALNWLVTHNQYYRSNHVHIDVNALEQTYSYHTMEIYPSSLLSLLRAPALNLLPPTLLQLVLL